MDARRIETPSATDSIGELPPRAGPAPVSPDPSGPDGGGRIGETEFMVRHDALAMALLAFERAPAGFRGTERFTLTLAARTLGWSGETGDRLLDWSRARVVAYRAVMAAAVREMLGAISINNSLTGRIGQ